MTNVEIEQKIRTLTAVTVEFEAEVIDLEAVTVELKERVIELEERVIRLEEQLSKNIAKIKQELKDDVLDGTITSKEYKARTEELNLLLVA